MTLSTPFTNILIKNSFKIKRSLTAIHSSQIIPIATIKARNAAELKFFSIIRANEKLIKCFFIVYSSI